MLQLLESERERLVAIRHELHAHPELSREEAWTSSFIAERLHELGLQPHRGIGGHGIVATIEGKAPGGVSDVGAHVGIGLRADMDALAITERTGLPYASTQPGKMHACGHDGHMAILLGAAMLLSRSRAFTGQVHLVFQPAEERYGGAQAMVDDGLLDRFPMQQIFGLHNWPGLPVGQIAVHEGPVMAGTSEFTVRFTGNGAHAAMPHLAGDPLLAGGHFMTGLQQAVARSIDPYESAVATVGYFKGGHAQNIIPQQAELGGTLRAYRIETLMQLRGRVESIAQAAAAMAGCQAQIMFDEGLCTPVINSPVERDIMREAARQAKLDLAPLDVRPTMAGDDFGDFLKYVPGAYAWIGNGPLRVDDDLHQPLYDFNDDIIGPAATLLATTAEIALSTEL